MRYSYTTPSECREHLDQFWRYGETVSQNGWRKRFAWLPVTIWGRRDGFVEPTSKRIWLSRVIEVYTLLGNWTAFEDYQLALKGERVNHW